MSSFVPGRLNRPGALRQRLTFERYDATDVGGGAHVDDYEVVRENVPAAVTAHSAFNQDRGAQADTTQRKRCVVRTPRTWYPDTSYRVLWRDPPWHAQPGEPDRFHAMYITSVEDIDGYRDYTLCELAMDPVPVDALAPDQETPRDNTP